MTKDPKKKWYPAKKKKQWKAKYRKPSVASIEAKRTKIELETQVALMRLAADRDRRQLHQMWRALVKDNPQFEQWFEEE